MIKHKLGPFLDTHVGCKINAFHYYCVNCRDLFHTIEESEQSECGEYNNE